MGWRQVGFREDYDSADARLARQHQIALDTRNVEVLIAGRDDKKRIDIRSDELNPAIIARSGPLEQARPIENADEASCFPVDQQPIADSWPLLLPSWDGQAGRNRGLEIFSQYGHPSA